MMRVPVVLIAGVLGVVVTAHAQQLALALKAQSDYDRVELSLLPQVAEAANCVQSQAAAIPVALPEELSLLYFRKGICALAGASVTRIKSDYLSAAADFDHAIADWGGRLRKGSKKPAEAVSTALRVLPWIAKLQASAPGDDRSEARRELTAALESPSCASNLMPELQCQSYIEAGREWLGWMALRDGRLDEAAKYFANSHDSGWPEWVDGRRQYQAGHYAAAATQYAKAIDVWKALWQEPGPGLTRRLGPRPELPQALADLGGAQLLNGQIQPAIASLDASIKADPTSAQAFYRRARAHELAREADAANNDYNMASRLAFANANGLLTGEAHLYRGIFLYRRKDYSRAEDEFASALNFQIAAPLKADAEAWRHLAAVAAGACVAARAELDRSLPAVSPYFPKEEARRVSSACTGSFAAGAAIP